MSLHMLNKHSACELHPQPKKKKNPDFLKKKKVCAFIYLFTHHSLAFVERLSSVWHCRSWGQ